MKEAVSAHTPPNSVSLTATYNNNNTFSGLDMLFLSIFMSSFWFLDSGVYVSYCHYESLTCLFFVYVLSNKQYLGGGYKDDLILLSTFFFIIKDDVKCGFRLENWKSFFKATISYYWHFCPVSLKKVRSVRICILFLVAAVMIRALSMSLSFLICHFIRITRPQSSPDSLGFYQSRQVEAC